MLRDAHGEPQDVFNATSIATWSVHADGSAVRGRRAASVSLETLPVVYMGGNSAPRPAENIEMLAK